MQKTTLSTYYLILGLILLPLGLLMLLGQPSLLSLMTNIMPSTQTIEIFGIVILFLGEGLVCYGMVTGITARVSAGVELNRQIMVEGVARGVQDQIAGVARSMEEKVAVLDSKLDQMHQATLNARISAVRTNCRFCGATIGDSRFCPSCGKAQN